MSTNDLYIKINNLNIEINKYNNLKMKLTSIINSLNESSASIADLPSTINNSYSLNENDVSIAKRCKSLNKDIVATSNYIKNVVIPSIDNSISRCRYNIAKLEAQMEATM
jgi:chromosome segregation ATPase